MCVQPIQMEMRSGGRVEWGMVEPGWFDVAAEAVPWHQTTPLFYASKPVVMEVGAAVEPQYGCVLPPPLQQASTQPLASTHGRCPGGARCLLCVPCFCSQWCYWFWCWSCNIMPAAAADRGKL